MDPRDVHKAIETQLFSGLEVLAILDVMQVCVLECCVLDLNGSLRPISAPDVASVHSEASPRKLLETRVLHHGRHSQSQNGLTHGE